MAGLRYRGRIAPTPTGYLHKGHARTFYTAWERAREAGGDLVFRVEDLDPQRCKEVYTQAAMEDLRWLGLDWDEGPEEGGAFAPYVQSRRRAFYVRAWEQLRDAGVIYPCHRSRKDVRNATQAPHADEEAEPIFPPEWRPAHGTGQDATRPGGVNWRFRVPDGRRLTFEDKLAGQQRFVAGEDFGDFLIWRRDDVPAYELAVVVDDHAMEITEVVRGADLLLSTARQLLLYEALGATPPAFAHCPLVLDENGQRLAKRNDALSLCTLRERGISPNDL